MLQLRIVRSLLSAWFMSSFALVLGGLAAIRPSERVGATPHVADASRPAKVLPVAAIEVEPSRYQPRKYPAMLLAVVITAAIHVMIVAMMLYEWHRPTKAGPPDETIVVTLLPATPDHPAHRHIRGAPSEKEPPKAALAEPPPPVIQLAEQPTIVAARPAPEPPTFADIGGDDPVARITQAYQQTLLSRLQAKRRYPRGALLDGYHGAGVVRFRIDRQGHLLDAVIEASTGQGALDRAALALIRHAAPLPVVPAELPDEMTITVPIEFLIVRPAMMVAAR